VADGFGHVASGGGRRDTQCATGSGVHRRIIVEKWGRAQRDPDFQEVGERAAGTLLRG